MKKVLIVLLSVLLALTFISCEKDKSGEVIQNYEDFKKSQNAYYSANVFCYRLVDEFAEYDSESKTTKIDKKLGDDDIDKIKTVLENAAQNGDYYFKKLLDVSAGSITVKKVKSVSGELNGNIENTEKYYKDEYTASNIVIRFTYTITTSEYNSEKKQYENKTSEAIDGELKINVKFSCKWTKGEETSSYNISSLSLQDVTYKDIAYTRATGREYTSATVGGAGVELRLLNADN